MYIIKIIVRNIIYITYLIVTVAILLEIIFIILPTSSPSDLQPTLHEDDILKYKPNQKFTFSEGKNFYKIVKKTTNNYGFFSSYDYVSNSYPDLMIIGDSMVQAAQISNSDSMGEIIQSKSNLEVYQLGVSGVPLSQYIQMLKFSKKEFSPKHYAVVVVGNDFDESLCSYRIKEGTWCFNKNFDLTFNPFYGYQGLRKIARKSAAMRYLVFHIGFDWRGVLIKLGLKDPGLRTYSMYAGNTERLKPEEIIAASKKAIEVFFEKLSELNLLSKITIIIDADRQDVYNFTTSKSYFNDMREFMKKQANDKNVNYIDMDQVFRDNYKIFNKKFEFPTDGHWNEYAHKLVAEELLKILYSQTK